MEKKYRTIDKKHKTKCKDCLMVADTPMPLCNYHQGYKKGRAEMLKKVLEIIGNRCLYTRVQGLKIIKEGNKVKRKKVFAYFRLKDVVKKRLENELKKGEQKK